MKGSALKAGESADPNSADAKCIMELMDAVDAYIPVPERAMDKDFLMPIEDVYRHADKLVAPRRLLRRRRADRRSRIHRSCRRGVRQRPGRGSSHQALGLKRWFIGSSMVGGIRFDERPPMGRRSGPSLRPGGGRDVIKGDSETRVDEGVIVDRRAARASEGSFRAAQGHQRFHAGPGEGAEEYAIDEYYGKAFELVLSGKARDAFDLTKEPDKVRERYGLTTFGQGLLLSRRLIEAGTRFVQMNWPSVANGNPEIDCLGHPRRELRSAEESALPQARPRPLGAARGHGRSAAC